ncbi:MAG TPA: futalosine hydrolase [Chitinophagaceae bacterium]|mgnify:CR=1 FL=1|nr:futalosine hydrolase [Chitinophagaceae bacterium]MCB9056756.1 futalosine hydrolase [Chitinophagales bacterium]HPG10651.1 futalosine hydrolase [Chitinophagaceae bacterium]HRX92477.1 futalosine hydrolase [Chitinophagaceae bacterium]
MNCLLTAATVKEISPFLNYYRDTDKLLHIDMNIDVLITGVGLTASTYHLTRQFSIRRPDLVIQAGVAGCFDKKIPLGSVLAITKDTIADESVVEMEKLKTLFDLKIVPQNSAPYTRGWLDNPNKELIKRSKLKRAKGISVNQITTNKKIIKFYTDHFDPVAESMEGAALHYVCLMEKIPFLQIRSISNYIGERNKAKWDIKNSISNLNKELIRLLEGL